MLDILLVMDVILRLLLGFFLLGFTFIKAFFPKERSVIIQVCCGIGLSFVIRVIGFIFLISMNEYSTMNEILLLSVITILFFITGLLRGSYWSIEKIRVDREIANLEKTLYEDEKNINNMSTVSKKEIRCPECKKMFMVEAQGKPFKVKCPFCGEEGKVK